MDDDNYVKFIKDCDYITSCQKAQYTDMKENLKESDIYKRNDSDIQIYTYIKHAAKDIMRMSKFKMLFSHFFRVKKITHKIIKKVKKAIINNEIITDTYIIELLSKYKQMDKYIEMKNEIKKKEKEAPVRIICSRDKYIFEYIGLKNRQLFRHGNIPNIKYLDYGCGFGPKTIAYSKELGIPPKNIYGTDIKQWGPYNQQESKFKFNFKLLTDDYKIDFDDNTFDIVSSFYVLHHVSDLTNALNEIKRVLKPNGYVLILEHDNHDGYDNLLIDIEHLLYATFVDKNTKFIEKPDYAKYYNWLEWNYIFSLHNFTYVNGNVLFTEVTHDMNYDNMCYAIYQNKK
jgi:ubiquinone/menaquinone biosynthesis C-methylase UbiE